MAIASSVPFNCHQGGEREGETESKHLGLPVSTALCPHSLGGQTQRGSQFLVPGHLKFGDLGDCNWVDLLWPAGRGASAVCRCGRLPELFEKVGANLSSLFSCVACLSNR